VALEYDNSIFLSSHPWLIASQYQYLKTLLPDPSNVVIGIVQTPTPVQDKLKSDGHSKIHIIQGDLTSAYSLTAAAAQIFTLTNSVVDHLIIISGDNHNPATLSITYQDYIGIETFLIDEVNNSMLTNSLGTLYAIMPSFRS
jgi:NAD(P)-dependent dehydrogenase (short-subunit alcohol dehydrogenase family)